MADVMLAVKAKNVLGETPLWDFRDQSLVWVDIAGGRINRLDPHSGEFSSRNPGQTITALGLRTQSGYIAAVITGFAEYTIEGNQLNILARVIKDNPDTRFNDGAVDPSGNFWAGLYNRNRQPVSALYRLDSSGQVVLVQDGVIASNGIGWSPDKQTMYHTDTARRTIFRYSYDSATADIADRQAFIVVPEEEDEGRPDGLAVDSLGNIWSARFGGSKVVCYDPAGKIQSIVKLPTPNVTSCTFGGPDLDQLYITTARQNQDQPPVDEYEGSLFVSLPGTTGQKAYLYQG